MTEHRDESLMDKIKGALGMGSHEDDHPDDMHAHSAGAGVATDASYGDDLGGSGNRPAGPDYAAEEAVPGEFGAGLDGEEMAGTGDSNTGTGLAYDFEERAVTEPVDESEWTRGGAASGESPLETTEDDEVDPRRRELGI